MNPADDRLKALFAPDAPPLRDPVFQAAVMQRLAKRRCVQDLAFLGGVSALGGLAMWALWPILQPVLTAISGPLAPGAAALAAALSAVAILGGFGDHAASADA
ncbi:MAG: hypothetical protein JWP73_2999 [Phenylobacterium sp.]|nr:hypothetical protein [Phenylobacterium sp.]